MKNESSRHNEWIPISSNEFNKEEFDRVLNSIDDRHFFNDTSKVKALEHHLKETLDTSKEVVCLSSGTAAIHVALLLAGVKKDDYVLCQSFTYVASVNPVLYLGAQPIFIDCNEQDWNLNIPLLEDAIVDLRQKNIYPKALIAVNNYGLPSDIVRLKDICKKYNIQLIEDAAESLGASFDGIYTGTKSDFGIFSFNNNKVFSTGGGGAIVCKDEIEKKKVQYYASHARISGTGYTHSEIGFNYRFSNIQAALGLSQLSSLKANIQKRKTVHHFYQKLFKDLDGVEVLTEPSKQYKSNHWLSCILIDSEKSSFKKEQILRKLFDSNIESRFLWKPMHMQPIFKNCLFYSCSVSEKLFANGLCLPSGSNLLNTELERISNEITSIFK